MDHSQPLPWPSLGCSPCRSRRPCSQKHWSHRRRSAPAPEEQAAPSQAKRPDTRLLTIANRLYASCNFSARLSASQNNCYRDADVTRTTKWNSLIGSLRRLHTGMTRKHGSLIRVCQRSIGRSCQKTPVLQRARKAESTLDGQRQERPAHAPCPPRASCWLRRISCINFSTTKVRFRRSTHQPAASVYWERTLVIDIWIRQFGRSAGGDNCAVVLFSPETTGTQGTLSR